LASIEEDAAAMQLFFKRTASRRRALPFIVAFLLVFQAGLAGLANGAAGSSVGLIAQICAVDSGGQSDDTSPPPCHHGGACCILQNNVLTEPDVGPAITVVLARIIVEERLSPQYRIDAVAAGPELEPQSPRAPPAKIV
jgi:hypothetical protein